MSNSLMHRQTIKKCRDFANKHHKPTLSERVFFWIHLHKRIPFLMVNSSLERMDHSKKLLNPTRSNS